MRSQGFTFKQKIWSLPLAAMAVFALGIAVNVFISNSTVKLLDQVEKVDYELLVKLQALDTDFNAIQETFKGAIAAADKNGVAKAGEIADRFRKNVREVALIPGYAPLAEKLKVEFEAYYSAAAESAGIMLQIRQGDIGESAARMQPALHALGATLESTRNVPTKGIQSGLADSRARLLQGLAINLGVAGSILLLLGVLSHFIIAGIGKQLGGEPAYATRIVQQVADGDLATDITVARGDSGSLLHAMRNMQARLQETVSGIHNTVSALSAASQQIAAGNTNLSQRTEKQAANLEETAASLEELSSTIRENTNRARQADELARTAADSAARGGTAVASVVSTMSSINESSKRIVDIIGVIDSIAFQTNILALNAAVEAARAGEQGRGFAVVASEVRNLAHRSSEAAKEISSLIKDSVGRVGVGSQQVEAAGRTMDEIVEATKRVTQIMGDIAGASAEQYSGIEQVNKAMTQLDGVTQENASLVQEATSATMSLEQQAASLAESVNFFKLAHTPLQRDVPSARPPAAKAIASKAPARPAPAPLPAKRAPRYIADATEDAAWIEF
jgi:methyl-accepting chemotaxis protein